MLQEILQQTKTLSESKGRIATLQQQIEFRKC